MRKISNPPTKEDRAWLKSWNKPVPGESQADDQEPDSGGAEADEESEYSNWSAEELKDELRSRELPVSGSKADLVQRLDASDAEDDEDEDEDE